MIYSWDYCRKSGSGGPGYEMRWAPAEDFMELKVMPRMLLDHLPDNVYKVLDTILREQKDNVSEIIWVLFYTFLLEVILSYTNSL